MSDPETFSKSDPETFSKFEIRNIFKVQFRNVSVSKTLTEIQNLKSKRKSADSLNDDNGDSAVFVIEFGINRNVQ